jgi:thiamine-phosphate diphosphorylase
MKEPVVCLVTSGSADTLAALPRIRAAVLAGVDLVQIREPRLPGRGLVDFTRRACDAASGSTRVVVNDRFDVAIAAGAHGVHLRGDSFTAARVRSVAFGLVIGRSVHSVEEGVAAEREGGCDYLIFGTVFASPSKPEGHRVTGLAPLREVCSRVTLPVLAIGGITKDRIADVRAAGAAGIAAIGLFEDAESLSETMDSIRRSFDT